MMASKFKYILFFSLLLLVGIYFYRKYKVAPVINVAALELYDINGERVNWQDYKGKKIILSFGASWCGNCRDEMKQISRQKQGLLKDVDVVIISDEELQKIQAWSAHMKMPYTYLQLGPSFPDIGIHSIPVTYIINKNLEVKAQEVGYIDWDDAATVESLLKLME